MHRKILVAGLAAAMGMASPLRAEVVQSDASGFVAAGSLMLARAAPQDVWHLLVQPGQWWSDAHSWSGSAANITLAPVAGGCMCEALPGDMPGSVEHMRVIHVRPARQLVMRGGLGPLQGEAVTGVLTITLEPVATPDGPSASAAGGTKISWTYVVGGYARYPLGQIAPAVDQVLAEQMARLAARLEAAE